MQNSTELSLRRVFHGRRSNIELIFGDSLNSSRCLNIFAGGNELGEPTMSQGIVAIFSWPNHSETGCELFRLVLGDIYPGLAPRVVWKQRCEGRSFPDIEFIESVECGEKVRTGILIEFTMECSINKHGIFKILKSDRTQKQICEFTP